MDKDREKDAARAALLRGPHLVFAALRSMDGIYIVLAVIVLLAGLVGVLLPFTEYARKSQWVQRLGEAHSAGLFLAVALCHMLPSAQDGWTQYQDESGGPNTDYPVVQLVVGVSFIFLFTTDLFLQMSSKQELILASSPKANVIGLSKSTSLAMALTFALISPVFLILAAASGFGANPLAAAFVQSAAAGTFFFLGFEAMGSMRGDHGHDHTIDTSSVTQAIMCTVFLSAHSILDGVVIGAASKPNDAAVLCFAISMHKVWAGMALGFQLSGNTTETMPILSEYQLENRANYQSVGDGSASGRQEDVESKSPMGTPLGSPRRAPVPDTCCSEYVAFIVGFVVLAVVAIWV